MNEIDPLKEAARRRRSRSLMVAVTLGAFVILLYLITIVRIGAQ